MSALTSFLSLVGRTPRGVDERPAPGRDVRRALSLLRALLTERGEVSGAKLASEALELYSEMDPASREAFFDALSAEFAPDPDAAAAAAQAYQADPSPKNLAKLQHAVEPPRQELFRRLNAAPGATQVLVAMRAQLLEGLKRKPEWEQTSDDLEHLFNSWFNRGFLTLQQIDWSSSASVIEKLIRYEAVHRMEGFPDVRRRLAADRRCYAFFHPAMPGEPIIFVEVALTRGISARVQPLLDPQAEVLDPRRADTAIFYSITNCQEGLKGVPFGSFLIKQVAEDLAKHMPNVWRYSTLSPVPGFAAWLKGRRLPDEVAKGKLAELCAYYLLRVKKQKEPSDPVARFHLRNGAVLERVNLDADTSDTGRERSLGAMVNYVYRLKDIEANHERYTKQHQVAAASSVESLAREGEKLVTAHSASIAVPVAIDEKLG